MLKIHNGVCLNTQNTVFCEYSKFTVGFVLILEIYSGDSLKFQNIQWGLFEYSKYTVGFV